MAAIRTTRRAYDGVLKDYEKKTVKSLTLTDLMIPFAEIIALMGLIPILILGPAKLIQGAKLSAPIPGIMSENWTLGAFTTYLTTFVLLASKASKDRQTLRLDREGTRFLEADQAPHRPVSGFPGPGAS
jgi:hypothetical protein